MKNNRLLTLVVVVVLLLAASGLAVNQAVNNMNLGLDLRGGVYVLYQAVEADDTGAVGTDRIDRAISVIRNRIDGLGVAEPVIQREGDDRIRVELAGIEDQQSAREVIGRTAMLTFVGPDGETILTGGDLRNAGVTFDERNRPAVSLEFSPEGTRKFAEATEKYLGQIIYIQLDDEVISNPEVISIIADGNAIITNQENVEEASNLALMLRSGALPVELVELETRAVGPTLGQDSLNRSVQAGVAGLILVLVFMLVYYRVFGIIASVSLITYLALVFSLLTAINATMTLFGIAGLILSVGMAVDANVIIFERIKEEIKTGRTMRTSIEAGFDHAFSAILDANVTTLIAAAILFYFATGPVRGFAVTLSIGILASMVTAIFLTRYLLRSFNKAEILRTPQNDAAKDAGVLAGGVNFVGMRKIAFILSAVLIIVGIVSMSTAGMNFGIDFTGGTNIHLNIGQDFTLEEAREVLEPLGLEGATLQQVGATGLGEGQAQELLIKAHELTPEEQDAVLAAFQEQYNITTDDYSVESVGAVVGGELTRQALIALLLASIAMIAYITLRFEYRFALSAIVALLHDALIVLAFFSVFRVEVNGPFIAAILFILGYSINDTIVIFDRVRENLKNRHKDKLTDVVNMSIRSSLRRSIITSLTTLLVLLTMYIFGGVTLQAFISALLVGVFAGTYSSIFIASPVWLSWKEAEAGKKTRTKTA
ncbi:protein translocase subunit SecD [Dethiobacter alkaliphilus]|uniref:protein translocase subunit SecD n=1 Tax=Dethiobacter alkaliphilus TaxID=427926 RepID=UPI0022261982|nr:protein translocase subunit SecD [Dethiobacter alkaliphilus]MCW3491277.1 protein translocase subunit SecD [Dethiobacter alkaliphilus]